MSDSTVLLDGKIFYVFGGSQGIGLGTAKKLAQRGGTVHIIARNVERGNKAVGELDSSLGQKHKFTSLDVTDMGQLKSFLKQEKSAKSSGIDGVVLCSGGLNYGPRRVTKEGVEVTFAQNYLSRFLILHEWTDVMALKNARAVHCLSLVGAGNGGKIDTQDMQLEKDSTFTPFFIRAALQIASLGDVMVQQFAQRFPKTQYFHLFPGFINTKGVENQGFPKFLSYAASFVLPILATDPSKPAELIVELLTSPKYADPSLNGGLVSPNGKVASVKEINQEEGNKVWEYTNALLASL